MRQSIVKPWQRLGVAKQRRRKPIVPDREKKSANKPVSGILLRKELLQAVRVLFPLVSVDLKLILNLVVFI
ncbi:hypothetical protein JTE90_001845 [Oedothorax gibbosus]|uniref:Uncharacterized protein n=1 Tax=Oedothorax gibbosus TaxID=931172 RepID=A0AAV6VPG7_9ARAC|nr:hypothetical protein JTE90_001845 [Oedothorax gibbosus]